MIRKLNNQQINFYKLRTQVANIHVEYLVQSEIKNIQIR